MGQCLSAMHREHLSIKNVPFTQQLNSVLCEEVRKLCRRWKSLGIPFFMSPGEFNKNMVLSDEVHLNYGKFSLSGSEIEVLEFLTGLVLMSIGPLEEKLSVLYELFQFEYEEHMTSEEFYVCIDKCFRAVCEEGSIQLPYIEQEHLEDFIESKCGSGPIDFATFKGLVSSECSVLSMIFQESDNFVRTLSTHIVEDPFTVIPYLQLGNLFLGKYEIVKPPILIEEISSIYKRKYKHGILDVKPMIGSTEDMKFELIYLTGINGDKSFRQNYFREIVLKNKLTREEVHEFGELPGGILYKKITELEATQMTLREYLEQKSTQTQASYVHVTGRRRLECLSEEEAIDLGVKLLDQLDILHGMHVKHSNINPSSVYLIEQDIARLRFLDLELAIWNPRKILGTDSPYFQQLEGDKYDTTFRDEDFLDPQHKQLSEEYKRTGEIPAQPIKKDYDLYSIGAIMFKALTGCSPVDFSRDTENYERITQERDLLEGWECPQALDHLVISNEMVVFLIRVLNSDPARRYPTIREMRRVLDALQSSLESIPKDLLKGLDHLAYKNPEKFVKRPVIDLHKHGINDFCLEYLYKFVVESNIPDIRLFGTDALPLRSLRNNTIKSLLLPNQNIFAEELKLLSFFIKINQSITDIDLSKNPILYRHRQELGENDVKSKDDTENLSPVGFEHFLSALDSHTNLQIFELAQIGLGPFHARLLCAPISKNTHLEQLNLAGCELHKKGVKAICRMAEQMSQLRYINLSSNRIGDEGAVCVAQLLERNHHILEIDLFRNNIEQSGGIAIGSALTNNFIIQKLSIGDNVIGKDEKDLILQSVMFNSQYKKLKATNERFGEFGYNLMAESIKRWIEKSAFVMNKLEARLHRCEDEIDLKMAELLLDASGHLNLNFELNT